MKLKITTPTDREIAMTREFDAPRSLIFDAHTKPELVKRWLGVFNGWELAVCEIDLRVGGKCRYEWRGRQNRSMGMTAIYREIVKPERLVHHEQFDDAWYEGECISTLVLTEKNGKTTLVNTVLYDTKEIRDKVLAGGMEHGVDASYDALSGLLAKL